MQFSFTSEQQEFRSVLRRYFEESSPTSDGAPADGDRGRAGTRAHGASSNQQLGLCGVHVPEDYGGQGFGFVELGIVLEEMGRALVCAPYFASAVLATTAIMNAATEAQKDALLPPHRAPARPSPRWRSPSRTAAGTRRRRRDHGDARRRRLHASTASRASCSTATPPTCIVVLARAPGSSGEDGLSFFTVRGDAPGLDPPAAEGARPDPQARPARVPRRRSRADRRARAPPPRRSPRRSTRPPRAWPARWSAAPSGCARIGARLRQPAHAVRPPDRLVPVDEAQAGRHAAGGRARQVGRLRAPPKPRPTTPTTCRRSPRSPRPPPRRPTCRPPSTRSRSTAASASPGTTTPTSGSSAPRAPRSSSATRPGIASA